MKDISYFLDKIICGDVLETLKQIPDESVDCVITSPPYNLKNSTGNGFKSKNNSFRWKNAGLINGYDGYDDNMPNELYAQWQRDVISECMRVLKNDSFMFYNHKWRVQNGLIQDRSDIMSGFPVRQIIIWERDVMVNFNDGYFCPKYEVIYVIVKGKPKLIKKANGQGDVWKINVDRKNKHPAPFPVELPDKIIKSVDAQIILDPFMGSGTTALAAIKNNRHYIGIEKSQNYVASAEKRINEEKLEKVKNASSTN